MAAGGKNSFAAGTVGARCPGETPHGCSSKLVLLLFWGVQYASFHFLPLHPLWEGAGRSIFQSRAYAPGPQGPRCHKFPGRSKEEVPGFTPVTGSGSSEFVMCDKGEGSHCEKLTGDCSLPRLGPICRTGAGPPCYPSPLHRQVSPADHGLPGEGLLC